MHGDMYLVLIAFHLFVLQLTRKVFYLYSQQNRQARRNELVE